MSSIRGRKCSSSLLLPSYLSSHSFTYASPVPSHLTLTPVPLSLLSPLISPHLPRPGLGLVHDYAVFSALARIYYMTHTHTHMYAWTLIGAIDVHAHDEGRAAMVPVLRPTGSNLSLEL